MLTWAPGYYIYSLHRLGVQVSPAWHHPNVSFKSLSWVLPNLQKPLKSDIQEHVQLAIASQIVSKQLLFNPHNRGFVHDSR
jgi:hypothetical protein